MLGKLLRRLGAGSESGEGRRPWVLHPFLIGIFPVVSLYSHNVYETSPRAMAVPIALVLAATFVAWLALRLISGDASRAGLAASLLVAAFFGFRGIHRACQGAWGFLSTLWVHSDAPLDPVGVMGLLAVALGASFYLVFRRLRQPARWTHALNLFTMVLVAMPTFGAASARLGEPGGVRHEAVAPTVTKAGWTPDIYYIVLDGYARGDVMKDLFGLDNAPFLGRLERRGFFVARQATANYIQTRLSIASSLNADYLDNLIAPSTPDLLPVTDLIRDNLVRRSLRPLGYRFVSFATGFDPTDFPDADLYLTPRPGNPEFSQILLEMTPLDAWLSEFKHNDRFAALRARTDYLLDRLPTIAGMRGPTFTFAHVLIPHPPFVFGEHGEDVSPRHMLSEGRTQVAKAKPLGKDFGSPAYFREAYRKQSAYITARVERAIGQILAASPEPPIIILQSDHGSWLRYHPDDLDATDLRERFGILECIYPAGRTFAGLSDAMTPVNTFRIVLNQIIGSNLPLLPDRNIFSPFHDPLVFTDVAERLRSPDERLKTFTYPSQYYGLDQQF